MTQIHLSLNPWLRLHVLTGAIHRYGGTMSTTLVTEEDLSLSFDIGPVDEPLQIVGPGAGAGDGTIVQAGARLTYRWDLSLMEPIQQSMPPHRLARFRRYWKDSA